MSQASITRGVFVAASERIQTSVSFKGRLVLLAGAVALLIFILTIRTFLPTLKNGFVWDDIQYITENQRIRSLDFNTLAAMGTTFQQSNWHPLTWISHAVDYALWGLDPSGHHLGSIVLHGLNTLLIFFLTVKLVSAVAERKDITGPSVTPCPLFTHCLFSGAITALLFSLHPLRVESVAWVAERKDLLCAFFFLCSIIFYLYYTSPVSARERRICFACCVASFVLSLASKPMAVTLPAILLLLDAYPLKRLRAPLVKRGMVVLEKIPLFAISIASVFTTIAAQNYGRTIRNLEQMPADGRILNALWSPLFYVGKMIVPTDLVPFYPFPKDSNWLDVRYPCSFLFVLAVTWFSLRMLKKGNCLFCVAWAYYIITISPVLGIIQVGGQSAADRYSYLPGISIFLLAGTGISWIVLRTLATHHKGIGASLMIILICYLFFLVQGTRKQILIWHDSESLWTSVVTMFPFPHSDPLVHYNLGNAYTQKGKYDDALVEFQRTLLLQPNHARAYNNLGRIYVMQGRLDEAIAAFKQAVAINPGSEKAFNNLGSAYLIKGDADSAMREIKRSLAINPNSADAHSNLALVYYAKGEYRLALLHYDEALKHGGTVNPQLSQLLKQFR